MKIGILTLHRAPNVGAVLQAFALQKYLILLGHEVSFIDYKPHTNYNWRFLIHKSLKVTYGKLKDYINLYKYLKNEDFPKCLNIVSPRYYNYEEIKNKPPVYDITIVGSDQVWNFRNKLDLVYLLEFLPEKAKRIAYAPSMGQTTINESCYKELVEILNKYAAISCREKNGTDFLNKLLCNQKKVVQVVDPTLLLIPDDYIEIMTPYSQSMKYIVSYILPDVNLTIEGIVQHIKNKFSCELINMRNPHSCARLRCAKNVITNPGTWLGYMRRTTFVICSSFHATVFSLLFHKPFLVIVPANLKKDGGNQRINSLLEPLGLLERCMYEQDTFLIDSIIEKEIDWNYVDEKIGILRRESKKFLQDSINEV